MIKHAVLSLLYLTLGTVLSTFHDYSIARGRLIPRDIIGDFVMTICWDSSAFVRVGEDELVMVCSRVSIYLGRLSCKKKEPSPACGVPSRKKEL